MIFSSIIKSSYLSRKLLISILLVSSLITLILTAIQLYLNFTHEVSLIEMQLNQVEKGFLESIAESVWDLDLRRLKVQLQGLTKLPGMHRLEVFDPRGQVLVSVGEAPVSKSIFKSFELSVQRNNRRERLGSLEITASLEDAYSHLKQQVVVILISQGLKTFLVSGFILFIVNQLVLRHLSKMARYARTLDIENLDRPLVLDTNPEAGRDELYQVAQSINTMRENILADVSRRKQAEKALQIAHDELEKRVEERTDELQKTYSQLLHSEKLSAVGRLSASIAHEFNNPLQGVMSVITGVKRRVSLDDEDVKLVDMAIRECNRMKDFIKDLQDFNRPSSGRRIPVDIHEAIDKTLLLSKKDLSTKQITVEKDYADNLPLVSVVSDQLKQVLLNLLNNAADSCEEGGGVIRISTVKQDNKLVLRVSDNGKGISQENIGHVFEPFFSTKPDVKGMGLGLSVSYGIIRQHGGTIEVESKEGKGATFIITLPIDGGGDV